MFLDLTDETLNAMLVALILGSRFDPLLQLFDHHGIDGDSAELAVVSAGGGVPIAVLGQRFRLPEASWSVMTWGGLRGGILVALALSLPPGEARDVVVCLIYLVVVFSILIQGMPIGKLIKRVLPCNGG